MSSPEKDGRQDTLLGRLEQEQLSAVVFVQNYLQLDFDGLRFTLNIWPIVRKAAGEWRFGDGGYRDELCSFIAERVVRLSETETAIEVFLGSGSLLLDLKEELTVERVILEDTATNHWTWW